MIINVVKIPGRHLAFFGEQGYNDANSLRKENEQCLPVCLRIRCFWMFAERL